MCNIKLNSPIAALVVVFLCFTQHSYAAEERNENQGLIAPFSISAPNTQYGWYDPDYEFAKPAEKAEPSDSDLLLVSGGAAKPKSSLASDIKKMKDDGIVDEVLSYLPYKDTIKSAWNYADGKADVFVEGLRMDRGNRGLYYKTDTVPMLGKVDGLKFEAEMGKSNAVSIEYKVSLDKLGF